MLTQLICKRIPVLRNFLGSLSSQISYSSVFSKKSMGPEETPVENAIRSVLQELSPVHLEVVNESYMHNVPKGSESHFKVLVVSEKFEGIPLIKRHRIVNGLIKEKLQESFPHALSLETKAPSQWKSEYQMDPSPSCRGGFGK